MLRDRKSYSYGRSVALCDTRSGVPASHSVAYKRTLSQSTAGSAALGVTEIKVASCSVKTQAATVLPKPEEKAKARTHLPVA